VTKEKKPIDEIKNVTDDQKVREANKTKDIRKILDSIKNKNEE
jgi:hypothetical protein